MFTKQILLKMNPPTFTHNQKDMFVYMCMHSHVHTCVYTCVMHLSQKNKTESLFQKYCWVDLTCVNDFFVCFYTDYFGRMQELCLAKKTTSICFSFLSRCLELQPNNLKALMALAVSYTNTGHQQEAYQALRNWIKQNPKYKYLAKSKKGSPALTRRMSKTSDER